ncbi:piggyBac transposable element-derived protein 4-like protein [Lates japonicus]|uniref:PiggyBac transposable element-derived protein 4-like protein n=1 Tax=Lates japonicus TaxID=270547 RepID=A0AAD3N0Y0_LATJO|nr:piggyBac transposable element-derived protein 4-like protein [Lates japonicus]
MAVRRFSAEMVVQMLQEERDEEDEETICSDSESEISDDDDDPEYLPQGQAGDVALPVPALLSSPASGLYLVVGFPGLPAGLCTLPGTSAQHPANFFPFVTRPGGNITVDKFFTSVPLAEKLPKKNLTIVWTLCQNKLNIPPIMKPSKFHNSEFGFNGNMTMVSYVQKKGKAVVLLSTMQDDKAVDDSSQKKKPDIIQYYNKTKGGVDTMDQMVSTFSCQ